MKLSGILGEDLEGLTLGDFAIRPQIMTDELVDLDVQPPPGVSGLGADPTFMKNWVRLNDSGDNPTYNMNQWAYVNARPWYAGVDPLSVKPSTGNTGLDSAITDVLKSFGFNGLGATAMRKPKALTPEQKNYLHQMANYQHRFKQMVTDESPAPTHGVNGIGSLIEELQGMGAMARKPMVHPNRGDKTPMPWWNTLFGRNKSMGDLGAVYTTSASYGGSSYLPLTSPQYNQQYYAGISSPYRYGTRNWWQWYATTYLPQYYNQQQIYSLLQQSPLYSTYGYPTGYNPNQYQTVNYGYPSQGQYNPYTGQYGYGYNQYPPNYGYYYGQQGAYGAQQCAASGGYYDYAQQQCYPQQGNYGAQTGTPPNVIGQSVGQGVSALNAAGFAVWERLRDGISQGSPPPTTATNRVVVDDNNGIISAAYVG